MRSAILSIGLALGACTDVPGPAVVPFAGDAPAGAQQAYFARFPERLLVFVAASCQEPSDELVIPDNKAGEFEIRCESLPRPEAAAAIILRFDGTVEDLPKLVTSFAGRDTPEGLLVTADNYIRVPQRNGGTQQVRFEEPSFAGDMVKLLELAGGRPL